MPKIALSALVALAGALAPPAGAAELSLCTPAAAPPERTHEQRYLDPTGDVRVLSLSASPAGEACLRVGLPISQDAVRWLGLASMPTLPDAIDLHGRRRGGEVEIESYQLMPARHPRGPGGAHLMAAPLSLDLLPRLTLRAYGIEERARVERSGDGVALVCRQGVSPAGVVLSAPEWRLPTGVSPELLLEGAGEGRFAVGLLDAEAERRGTPIALGDFAAGTRDAVERLALPAAASDGKTPLGWSLACPEAGGALSLRSLQLAAPAVAPPPPRAAWAWDPARWRSGGEELLQAAANLSVGRLYVAVPIKGSTVADPERLARFVAAASDRGIDVWSVEGDPHAVLPAERGKFVDRARALSRYNAAHGRSARLAGIQYDIEPYILQGYALDPPRWQEAYAATIAALAGAGDMPIEVVLPYWVGGDEETTASLLAPLAANVGSIAVMDYRTDPFDIQAGAAPFLAWGSAAQKPVWIALENGPLDDELIERYRRAPSGELWAVPLGTDTVLVLLERPVEDLRGQAYALEVTFAAPARRTSFLGDRERLLGLLPALAESLRAWPSFAGLALHGML